MKNEKKQHEKINNVIPVNILPKYGSSDGRAGHSRSKGPGFDPRLDPMRCASNYDLY